MGICIKSSSKNENNVLLTGISLSGKTYFLYRHLKYFIGNNIKARTKTTYCKIFL